MPLSLNFRVEDRGGVMVLVQKGRGDEEVARPASSAEVELWNALARKFATPARESYIRVNEQDLVNTLIERDHLRRQLAEQEKKVLELEAKLQPKPVEADGQQRPAHEAPDDGSSPGREQGP